MEVVSDADASEKNVEEKLWRYRQAGVGELVRYDPEEATSPLRFWDLLDGDLVERALGDPEATRCDALGLYWCLVPDPHLGPTLRLARDRDGRDLLLTPAEAAGSATDAERAAKEVAQARVAELEAELAQRP